MMSKAITVNVTTDPPEDFQLDELSSMDPEELMSSAQDLLKLREKVLWAKRISDARLFVQLLDQVGFAKVHEGREEDFPQMASQRSEIVFELMNDRRYRVGLRLTHITSSIMYACELVTMARGVLDKNGFSPVD